MLQTVGKWYTIRHLDSGRLNPLSQYLHKSAPIVENLAQGGGHSSLVYHDLAEYGAKQSRPSVLNAPRLHIYIATVHGLGAGDV